MIAKTPEQESELIRTEILDAAEQRLRTYGYGKTTMAEIATDVGMSAANLYRYFDNKLDIGAALAQRCFRERFALLQAVVERTDLNASQKLEEFVVTNLHYTHTQFSETPKVNELVDIIVAERCEIIQAKIENDLKLINQILQEGIKSKEFSIDDMPTTAQAVLHAIVKFSVPLFMTMYPLNEFEQHARDLVALLIRGLSNN
ncbi:MAG: TetR/AcrR family transcriptional regulator [Gammaproteobacteria bacterium]|nr:TetR/AcrR family transcriptional regulator [Gammaproteobacteria bacterium]